MQSNSTESQINKFVEMKSDDLFSFSKEIVPGGVHSPVRSFKGLHVSPRFVKEGNGAFFTDVEENTYLDFCMSFGPLILGHQNSHVKAELEKALNRGWTFGACEPYSVALADFLMKKLSFVDQVRFVNSGTEAVMTALRLARGVTKRPKIIKFNGCYHGHVDSMLIKAGSGLAGEPEASSLGIPKGIAQDTIVCELNNEEEIVETFAKYKDQIACIIVEPLPANNGLLVQNQHYLKFLREQCDKNGALLIFDEVISGFRVAFGGMVERTGIQPDLVTYGKIIGGGLPVGAIAGKKNIMECLAPTGGVYQAGTLSANPLAMVSGLASLEQLTPDAYETMDSNTRRICNTFRDFFATKEEFKDLKVYSFGTLFWITPKKDRIRSLEDISGKLSDSFFSLFQYLLPRGIYLAPNAYEVGFASLAHDEKVNEYLKKNIEKEI